jgi:acyl dehydratase
MVDYDPGLIGKVFEGKRRPEIKQEMIDAYCDAIGDINPLYRDAAMSAQGPDGGALQPGSVENRWWHYASVAT